MVKFLHATLTQFKNESRIIKQINSFHQAFEGSQTTVLAKGAPKFEVTEACKVIRFHNNVSRRKIFKLLQSFSVFLFFLKQGFSQKPDVIVLHHTILIIPFLVYKAICPSVRLIYDAHELETERYGLTTFSRPIYKLLEKIIIKVSDLNFVVSPSIQDWYSNKYTKAKFHLLPNSFNSKQIDQIEKVNLQKVYQIKEGRIAIHSGTVTNSVIQEILEVAFNLQDHDVAFVFLAAGAHVPLIENFISKTNLRNIYLIKPVKLNEILSIVSGANVGFCLVKKDCLSYEYSLPNKLFEYIYADVPIIAWPCKDQVDVVYKKVGVVDFDESVSGLETKVIELLTRKDEFDFLKAQRFWDWDVWFDKIVTELNIKLKY